MRYASRSAGATEPVPLLPASVAARAGRASPVAPLGLALLLAAGCARARLRAVALPPIAASADPSESPAAFAEKSLSSSTPAAHTQGLDPGGKDRHTQPALTAPGRGDSSLVATPEVRVSAVCFSRGADSLPDGRPDVTCPSPPTAVGNRLVNEGERGERDGPRDQSGPGGGTKERRRSPALTADDARILIAADNGGPPAGWAIPPGCWPPRP